MYRRREHFSTVWLVKTNVDIKDLTLQPSEVSDVKWVNQKQLKEMLESGEFFNYPYLDLLFSVIGRDKKELE